jgi:cytochrome c553
MRGSHHGNSTAKWKDGSTLVKSYRFLSAVQGMEDPEYEYRPDRKHHNKYYGIDRIAETQDDDGTISSLCAQCHTDYHQGNGKISTETFGRSAWLRHPTDFDMGNIKGAKSEYADYNPDGMDKNAYSVIAPVATSNTTEQLNERVYVTPRDAIVMCLSCHRAHGTPHDAILRWDYKAWPGPGGYNGCAICHTTKD